MCRLTHWAQASNTTMGLCLSWSLILVCMQEQANALHAMGMLDYWELKHRLMTTTAGLVFAGSLIAFAAGGLDAAYPFAIGGCAGVSYQWLLQQSVDSLPASQRLQVQHLQQQGDIDKVNLFLGSVLTQVIHILSEYQSCALCFCSRANGTGGL